MTHSHDRQQLAALESWRNSELERAQVELRSSTDAAHEQERVVVEVREQIEATEDLARAATAHNARLSADGLLRIAQFSQLQRSSLARESATLEESHRAVGLAQRKVADKFTALSVIDRLRERREALARLERQRREQHTQDNQALMREAWLKQSQCKQEGE